MAGGEFVTCVGDFLDDGTAMSGHAEMRIARLPGVDVVSVGDPLVELLDSEFARMPSGAGGSGAATNDLVFHRVDGRMHADFVDKPTA